MVSQVLPIERTPRNGGFKTHLTPLNIKNSNKLRKPAISRPLKSWSRTKASQAYVYAVSMQTKIQRKREKQTCVLATVNFTKTIKTMRELSETY